MQIIQGCILLTVLNITWYKCRPESSFLNQGLVTHIQQQDPFPPMHINSSISQDGTWLLLPEAPRGVFLLLCSSPSTLCAPCTVHTRWVCTAAAWFRMAVVQPGLQTWPWFHSRADRFARSQIQFPVKQKRNIAMGLEKNQLGSILLLNRLHFSAGLSSMPFQPELSKKVSTWRKESKAGNKLTRCMALLEAHALYRLSNKIAC